MQGQGRKRRKPGGVHSTPFRVPFRVHPTIGCRTRLLRTQGAELEGSGEGQGPQIGPRTHTLYWKNTEINNLEFDTTQQNYGC